MQIFNDVNKILNSKATSIALFTVTGASRMFTDYQKANTKKEKRMALIDDSAVLLGAGLGIASYTKATKIFMNSSVVKSNPIKKIGSANSISNIGLKLYPKLKSVVKGLAKNLLDTSGNCIDNALLVAFGISGAVTSHYLLDFAHDFIKKYIKPTSTRKIVEKVVDENGNVKEKEIHSFDIFKTQVMQNNISRFDNYVGKDTRENIFSNLPNMPEMKIFTSSVIGSQSFEIAEEKSFKKKLKKATKNIITGTMVPIFFLSLASNLTKGAKAVYRIPFSFASMIAGSMYVNKKLENQMKKFDD